MKNSLFPILLIDHYKEVDLEKHKDNIGDGVEFLNITVILSLKAIVTCGARQAIWHQGGAYQCQC